MYLKKCKEAKLLTKISKADLIEQFHYECIVFKQYKKVKQ